MTTRHIKRVDVRSVLPISASIFFVYGLVGAIYGALQGSRPIVLPGIVSMVVPGESIALIIAFPFLSAAIGAVISTVVIAFYNLLAPRVGAIKIDLE